MQKSAGDSHSEPSYKKAHTTEKFCSAQGLMSKFIFRDMIQNAEITATQIFSVFSGSSDVVISFPILQATFQYEALKVNMLLF